MRKLGYLLGWLIILVAVAFLVWELSSPPHAYDRNPDGSFNHQVGLDGIPHPIGGCSICKGMEPEIR